MRKRFRVVKSGLGYTAELNTRARIGNDAFAHWEDSWFPLGATHETLEEAKLDIETYKVSIDTEVVYEE